MAHTNLVDDRLKKDARLGIFFVGWLVGLLRFLIIILLHSQSAYLIDPINALVNNVIVEEAASEMEAAS